jgi:hypothetical protein
MLEFEGLLCLYEAREPAVFAGNKDFTGLDGKRAAAVSTTDLLHYIAQAQSSQQACVSS